MALHVIERLQRYATQQPDSIALRQIGSDRDADRTLTYRQLASAVAELADELQRELPRGAVVLLCYPNELECVVGFFAAITAGATVFPVHPHLAHAELVAAAKQSRAIGVICSDSAWEALRSASLTRLDCPSLDRRPAHDDNCSTLVDSFSGSEQTAALLLQSSGTTGAPKIVRRIGSSLDAVARNVADSVRLGPEDRVLGVAPACHSYGVENVILGPIYAGSCVHLCGHLDAGMILRQLEHDGITVFPGVPSMFEVLAGFGGETQRFRTLRCAYSAGATLPMTVFDSFERVFGVRIGQLYGMTEIGSVTFNDPNEADHDPQSVGRPMDGVRIRVVNPDAIEESVSVGTEGEVLVAAPSMLAGYVQQATGKCVRPESVVGDFFQTGDLGRLDELGRLTITGRLKLVVDVGGMKVNLQEVERVLGEHESVDACVVTPVMVSETVSRLKAFVVPKVTTDQPQADELRSFLRGRLAAHKVPRVFELRQSLPRSATGKILRSSL